MVGSFDLMKIVDMVGMVAGISKTLKKVSVSTTLVQSRLVSLLATLKMNGLRESRYQQRKISWVSGSLSLENHSYKS